MFYERYIELCGSINKSPTAVALDIGVSRGTVSNWKKGAIPNDVTLAKIANYFKVSISYLIGNNGSINISGNNLNGTYNMVGNSPQMNVAKPEELTAQEHELLTQFRRLSEYDKAKAFIYIAEIEVKTEKK